VTLGSPAPRSRALLGLPVLALVLLLVRVEGYGPFRDELYYLACGRHLAWGYVDHPPLIGLVAWAIEHTLGTSLLALRLGPAVAAAGAVYLVGALAAELGGRRGAQLLAGLSFLFAPVVLSLFSYLSMNALDLLVWSAAFLLFARLLRAGRSRDWLVLGLVLGVGLENKLSVLFLGFGLAVGLLASARELLATRGPWLALALAALLFLPHLVWQVQHGAPTLEFMANARAVKMVAPSPLGWLTGLWEGQGVLAVPVWAAGLYLLLRTPRWRALGVASLAVLAALIVGEGKVYYAAPAFVPLVAAGGVFWARRARWAGLAVGVAVVAGGLVALPFARPILPVADFVAYQRALGEAPAASGERHAIAELPQFFADMHGWPELAADVGAVFAGLPAADRAVACVFAGNYGQAGAIDVLGAPYGLPPAISGHNAYWTWGPRGCTGAVVLIIGGERADLEPLFARVDEAAVHRCAPCMPYEDGKRIWVARGLRGDLATLWPRVKHYE
jgi:hypothetical protein